MTMDIILLLVGVVVMGLIGIKEHSGAFLAGALVLYWIATAKWVEKRREVKDERITTRQLVFS